MNTLLTLSWQVIDLAQAATNPSKEPAPWYASQGVMFAVIAVVIVFLFSSSNRGNRQAEKKHKDMLTALKRGDRVQTIGGILGSVVEARETEVVLKIDEGNNTKIRIAREAIKRVMADEPEPVK